MEAKHYEMLGSAVRRGAQDERVARLSDVELGKLVVQYVLMIQGEADRDARERVNKQQGEVGAGEE